MRIKIEEIRQMCMDVLLTYGLSKDDAEIVSKEYLYGEMAGKKSHGFASFTKMEKKIQSVNEKWKIVKDEETYALIDGKGNLGQLVGKFAMELAIKKAKAKGISLIGMFNMQSYLMPGYYAKMASDNDMIGIVIDNSRSRVVPFGGTESRLGSNPIGISVPTKDTPIILDMATSTRAMGEVRLAKKLGELCPEGMAVDKDGNPTQDPDKVSALTPLGGYKGYSLALAIEILAGSLVRAKMGSMMKTGLNRGFLFIAIDPTIFIDLETFKDEVLVLLKEIKTTKKTQGVEEILIPGERATRNIAECQQSGYVEVDDKIIKDIKNLAK